MLASTWAADRAYLAAIALAVAGNIATYLFVALSQPSLPAVMPLHYNGIGAADVIGSSDELLRLPGIGSVVLAANTLVGIALHGGERTAAHTLAWTAVAVQIILGSGAWVLVQRAAAP